MNSTGKVEARSRLRFEEGVLWLGKRRVRLGARRQKRLQMHPRGRPAPLMHPRTDLNVLAQQQRNHHKGTIVAIHHRQVAGDKGAEQLAQ